MYDALIYKVCREEYNKMREAYNQIKKYCSNLKSYLEFLICSVIIYPSKNKKLSKIQKY